ncbi:asparagine synthase (glutamine-hydrolyzing) [Hydrogenophaga sp. MI9]|uniref:asparagine synthase (glutamine-hydrolyzing) n=1 Tax=Hydrogenophaga sp. MI9 TaxID=3453719 RepID=UPI003EE99048
MCGLAGIVGRVGEANRAALRRMTDAMAHRGPDGDGLWMGPADQGGWGVMLGHRRLSILDLSTAASQPMEDPQRGDVAVLNGEIYNYVEIRRALEAQGHALWSTGDTAAMLRLLSLRGFEAVRDLRGMFAIALWDPRRCELLLARDALGIKPLYFARNPDPDGEWSFAFASEVRALLRSGLLRQPRLRSSAVASVVWNGFTVAPETIVDGIESLLPGEMRVYAQDGRERQRQRYWTQAELPRPGSSNDRDVSAALEDSVQRHLASDVPLAVFLSGGVDSSAIANVARRVSRDPVHTFTLAFTEQERNEGDIAKAVSAAIGTQHHEIVLRQEDFLDRLDEAIGSLDQPSFDGLNSFFMSQAVAQAGFKVALVGSGGDELFGGYTSFRDLPAMAAWSRRLGFVPEAARNLAASAFSRWKAPGESSFPPQTRWAKLPTMVAARDDLLALYQCAYALFLPETHRRLLGTAAGGLAAGYQGLPAGIVAALGEETAGRSDLASIAAFEQRLFLGERLLRDTDSTSMAASIETRLPLVDQQLLEVVAAVPDGARFHPVRSKAMLRAAGLQGLDPALFDRPKSGFELPFDHWLHGPLGAEVGEVLGDGALMASVGLSPRMVEELWRAYQAGAPGLYWTRIWCLYTLAVWARREGLSMEAAA